MENQGIFFAFATAFGPTQFPNRYVPGVKQLRRKVDHLLQCSIEVENAWSYTSTPP